MADKELKDWSYEELINYLTGRAIMSLGAGESLRSIVSTNVHYTNQWTHALRDKQEKEKNEKGRGNK